MRKSRWLCAVASVSLLFSSCDAPTGPLDERDIYAFRFPDGKVFRWPSGSVIRVYADLESFPERAELLRSSLDLAVGLWNSAAPNGEYELRVVERPEEAHVLLSWFGAPPRVATDGCDGVPLGTYIGLTDWCRLSGDRLKRYPLLSGEPSEVRMVVRVGGVEPDNAPLVQKTVVHEMGHVLGLLAHSKRSGDVMASDRGPADLTQRDRNTVAVLYESYPNFQP